MYQNNGNTLVGVEPASEMPMQSVAETLSVAYTLVERVEALEDVLFGASPRVADGVGKPGSDGLLPRIDAKASSTRAALYRALNAMDRITAQFR
jgi:hypothetical protein